MREALGLTPVERLRRPLFAPVDRDRATTRVLAPLLTLAPALAFYAAFVDRSGFRIGHKLYFSLFDDAMISMRYAANLAHGSGLVWNPNQHPVEGFTNPLWTLWMAVLHLLPVGQAKISLAVTASGALLLLATALVAGELARTLGAGEVAARMCVVATSLTYPLVYWTLRGMETGLAAFVVAYAALQAVRCDRGFERRRVLTLAAAVSAGVLTRMDLVIPLAVIALYASATSPRGSRRRVAILAFGALVVTTGAETIARLVYYGLPFPNTYYLKVVGVPLSVRASRGVVALLIELASELLLPTVVAAAFVFGLRRTFRRRNAERHALLLAAVFASACAYSVYVGGDAWEWMGYANRYITVALPLLTVLVVLAVQARIESPSTVRLALGVAIALLIPMNALGFYRWTLHNAVYVDADAYATRYGLELRKVTTPDTTIAVVWAGAIAYFADRPAVDLLGKSDHVIAERPSRRPFWPGHSRWDYAYSIRDLKPDIVTDIWHPTAADLANMRRWGYTQLHVPGELPLPVREPFIRNTSRTVDTRTLRRWLSSVATADSVGS